MKKCLVISYGPVPVPEHPIVEGGGLRCWGLAKGLKQNDPTLEVTVAYHESHMKPKPTKDFESIGITSWSNKNIPSLLSEYDSIIVSYCMGEISVMVADFIRPDQQLILDCYVPIFVEVSARNSDDVLGEYNAFHNELGRWAHVLRRGDFFLCASEAQKKYYFGVLSAVGRINPVTYDQDLISITPYGIYRDAEPVASEKPITSLMKGQKCKKILWFGGIYPWFDLRDLVKATAKVNEKIPVKLVIVGAKNPFNNHPDFLQRYEELVSFIESDKKYKNIILMQDWVKFDERANWYLDSDLVVVVNKDGEENKLAWRTRLVDFMWANLPVVTNGGDPLGELLINQKAAAKFKELDAISIANKISGLLEDPAQLRTMQANMAKVKKNYYWDVVTRQLTELVQTHSRSKDLDGIGLVDVINPSSGPQGKARRVMLKIKKVPAYAKKNGVRVTVRATTGVLRDRVADKLNSKATNNPRILFFSHQLDLSGAPTVFMDVLDALIKNTQRLPIEFHTFGPAHKDNFIRLNRIGIKPKLHLNKDLNFKFHPGDVIIFNTVAHSSLLKESAYSSLESGEANKLIWYIHEDEPELIFGSTEKKRLQTLLAKDKLTIFIAAKKTLNNYQKFFDNASNIRIQDHKLVFDERYQKIRKPEEFNTLQFILPGTVSDGRKGQMPILYALGFLQEYVIKKKPEIYRDFSVTYVGMYSDFISRQIEKHAPSMNIKFNSVGHISHNKLMDLYLEHNVTVCYSMRECLPLFVFEGMITGHPILRNDSSGCEEQLKDDKNGYFLPSDDILAVANAFEKILNTKKTSNEDLAMMSAESHKISKALEKKSYSPIVEEIIKGFNDD